MDVGPSPVAIPATVSEQYRVHIVGTVWSISKCTWLTPLHTAQPDGLDTAPLYHGRRGPSIHQSELYASLVLQFQSFLLHDIKGRTPSAGDGFDTILDI